MYIKSMLIIWEKLVLSWKALYFGVVRLNNVCKLVH